VSVAARYRVGDFLEMLPAPVAVAPTVPTQRRSAETLSGLPGTVISRVLPVSELLIGAFGMRRNSVGLVFPHDDGTFSRTDSHVRLFPGKHGEECATVFGERAAKSLNVPAGGGSHSSFSILIESFCAGDSSLATRLAKRYLNSPEDLVTALAAKPTVADLTNLSRRPALTVVDEPYADAPYDDIEARFDDIEAGINGEAPLRPKRTARTFASTTLDVPDNRIAARLVNLPRTELGMAERWAAHYTGTWRLHPRKGLMTYTGQLWEIATPAQVAQSVKATIRFAHDFEADLIENEQREKGAKKELVEVDNQASYRDWCRTLETHSHVLSIAAEIATLPALTTEEEDWDTDDLFINTPRGVFDFIGKTYMPHDPSYMMTMITKGSGDRTAKSAALTRALAGLEASHPGTVAFLQMLAGAALLGLTHDAFAQVWGAAGTGKSTVLAALVAAMGGTGTKSYAATLKLKNIQFTPDGGDKPEPAIERCRDKRLVYVDEASGVRLDAELLKGWTGGAPVTSRGLHQAGGEWLPKFMLLTSGNGRLNLPNTDGGILRRFLPIRITAKITGTPDGTIRDTLTKTQEGWDAVLAWAMEGAVKVAANGSGVQALEVPQFVKDELADYMAQLDPLLDWWEMCVEELPVSATPPTDAELALMPTISELQESFTQWSFQHLPGAKWNAKDIPPRLEARGFPATIRTTRTRPTGTLQGRYVDGIKLRPSTGFPHINDTQF
jgi:phage/plasmid-associated DNA primase